MLERETQYTIGDNGGTIRITSRIPTCICPEYWQRHQLILSDVMQIVSYVPTNVVWMSAMICQLHCPWFVLRSSSSSTYDITLMGKSIAVEGIIRSRKRLLSTVSKLDTDSIESFDHVPPIPRSVISASDIQYVSSGITSQLMPRALTLPTESIGNIPLLYRYLDLDWVPVGLEGGAVCCNAVIPESLHTYMHRGITHDPKVGLYKGVPYCLTDELILFIRPPPGSTDMPAACVQTIPVSTQTPPLLETVAAVVGGV